jgi:PAS domain S-box-containing protein
MLLNKILLRIDWFIPAEIAASDQSHLWRSRLLVAGSFGAVIFTLYFLVGVFAARGMAPAASAFFIISLALLANPFILRHGRSIMIPGVLFALELIALIGFSAYQNGVLNVAALFWTVPIPLLAGLLVGPRFALLCSGLVVGQFVGLSFFEKINQPFPQPAADDWMLWFQIAGLSAMAIFMAGLSWLPEQTRNISDKSLEKKVAGRTGTLEGINEQLQLELERLRQAEQTTARRLSQQTALSDASRAITESLDYTVVLTKIAEWMCRVVDATSVYISDWDSNAQTTTVVAEYISPHANARERQSDLGETYFLPEDFPADTDFLRTKEPDVEHVDDPDIDESARSELLKYGAKSSLTIPLVFGEHVHGYVEIWESRNRREFTAEEINVCQGIALQAAIAIENAQLYETERYRSGELSRSNKLITALSHVGARLVAAPDPEAVMDLMGSELNELGIESVVTRLDPTDGMLVIGYSSIQPVLQSAIKKLLGKQLLGFRLPRFGSFLGVYDNILEHRRTVYIPDLMPSALEILPGVPRGLLTKAVKLIGLTPGIPAIIAPLVIEERVLGSIGLWSQDLKEDDIPAISVFAYQVSIAIENARLFTQVEQRASELATVLTAVKAVSSTLDLDEVLRLIAEQMVKAINVGSCALSRWEPDTDSVVTLVEWSRTIEGQHDRSGTRYPLDKYPVTRAVLEEQQPMVIQISDSAADPAEVALLQNNGRTSLLMLALAQGERVIGLVELVAHEHERIFTEEEIQLCQALADQAAIAIENANLYERAEKSASQREHLLDVSRSVLSTLDLDAVLHRVTQVLQELIPYETAGYYWLDEERTVLRPSAMAGKDWVSEELDAWTTPIEKGIVSRVIKSEKGELVNNAHLDSSPDYPQGADINSEHLIGIPIQVKSDIVGVFILVRAEGPPFTEDDLKLVELFISQVAIAIENARLYKGAQDYAARLEQEVDARTSELLSSNKKLRREVVQRRNAETVLQQSEKEYRELVEALQEGIWVIDEDAYTTFVNRPMADMLGYETDEMQGKHLFSFMDDRGIETATRSLKRRRQGIKEQHDLELLHKNGTRVWTTMETASYTKEDGKYAGSISGVIDITQRKQAEVRMQQQSAHLKQVNSELEQYAWIIAHDLKAPLRTIGIYTDLLARDLIDTLSTEQREYLATLSSVKQQADELVQGLLALAQVGNEEACRERIPMKPFFEELIALLNCPPDVEIVLPETWPTIEAVEPILRQLFQNLLTNAVKYNRSSQKRIQIGWRSVGPDPNKSWLSLEHPNEHYEFFVRDNGIGIAHEYHEQVFGIFKRLHVAEDYPGTGIGLAIVRKAVGKLRGSIYIQSQPGEGSTFYVTLPSSWENAHVGDILQEGDVRGLPG